MGYGKINKRIDLGEYIIIINYVEMNGSLKVIVLDELEDIIDEINIINDGEEDENTNLPLN